MRLFPEFTLQQLEFDKIKELIGMRCHSAFAKQRCRNLRIHDNMDYLLRHLHQTNEFKTLLEAGDDVPNNFTADVSSELKMLSIQGAVLSGEQIMQLRRLTENAGRLYRWFNRERTTQYPSLSEVIQESYYEKTIIEIIDEVLDENGVVKDTASEELAGIRLNLFRKRNQLRRQFDKIVQQLQKAGYLADIAESFMNGRRVLAVLAEKKRAVNGIIHSESDTGKTCFIEPEETTALNNEIAALAFEEMREVNRVLRKLTADLHVYSPILNQYLQISGELDFIRARAGFALEIGGNLPRISKKPVINLVNAFHPLLLLYNRKLGKPTIPLNVHLYDQNLILVISGPNAGGKTVTLKTVGLLQLMLQSGLLVPVSADSEMGIFSQLLIHIGDTQSLEFELSTYSSHLRHMKYFIEHANGRTLFFIDELGSGSDPNLGGAFAEVILEELAAKRAFGIVTTHYLNLKVMANKVKGLINGAMQFNEQELLPLYKLQTGKPGSSYTFSIAERIGLPKTLIEKARKQVDENQYRLDRMLNHAEQDMQNIQKEQARLQVMIKDNELLKKEMEKLMNKEKHRQQVELLKQQNKLTAENYARYKDLERKMRAMVQAWKKTEDKNEAVKTISALLFNQQNRFRKEKIQKTWDEKYIEVGGEIKPGDKVKMKNNRWVGIVKEIRGKKAILQVGSVPITVVLDGLIVVKDKVVPPGQNI